jgi:hypothetical protein
MDLSYLVKQIKEPSSGLRLRQAKVIASNNSPKSIDVQIAGDSNTLPSVKYLKSYNPSVNDTVWLLSNGADVLCIGIQA